MGNSKARANLGNERLQPVLQRFRVLWALMAFALFYDLAFLDGRIFYANVRRAIIASIAILMMAVSGIFYSILMIFRVFDVWPLAGAIMLAGAILLFVAAWGRKVEVGYSPSRSPNSGCDLSILIDLDEPGLADFVSRATLLAEENMRKERLRDAEKLVEYAQTIWFFCILERHPILRGVLQTQSQYLRSMQESVQKFLASRRTIRI